MKNTLTPYILFTFSLFFAFTACTEDKEIPFTSTKTDASIKEFMKQGWLLKSTEQTNDKCIFLFENEKIEMPACDIINIQADPTNWNTTVTYSNGEIRDIPTLGESIDEMVSFIKVNPSGYNPLAAQIRMNFPQGGAVHTIVYTKNGNKTANIEHTHAFSLQTVQFIDILGLYADYINKAELIYTDPNGKERGRTKIDINVDALQMDNLPNFKVAKALTSQMEPGLNLVNSPGHDEDDTSRPYMVDADGEIRWLLDWRESKELLHIGAQCGLYRLPNGHFITGDANNNQLAEVDLLGNLIRRWDLTAMGYSFHHEVQLSANGKYLVAVTKKGTLHIDEKTPRILDYIIEFDPESGAVTHEWDLATILDSDRITAVDSSLPGAALYGQSKTNWLHNNGITEFGDDIIATGRWQGVFSYNRNGALKWIIAPHNNWRDAYTPYLLQPLDKNGEPITDTDVLNGQKAHPDFEWTWGVHCPNILPNGHILVFDNGYCRNYIPRRLNENESYSRVVEYEIDEANKTVRQVWQYGKERGRACYSPAISGVQYLPQTGNRLFCPGMSNQLTGNNTGGRIVEINPQTGEVVFELEIETNTCASTFHRADRMTLYPN